MKIAIFHDFFGTIGGGERLVLELAKDLNADIYTTFVDRKNVKKLGFSDSNIISLGNPVAYPILRQIHTSILFAKAKKQNYKMHIMSGVWSIFAAKNHQPNILYCHTPVRMFYNDYEDFKKIANWWQKPGFFIWVKIHKILLEKNLKYLNNIVTNSQECKQRVKKYYKRNCDVIHPPIKQYKLKKYGDFWLSVNRIYPHKRIELQLEAFRKLPNEKLIIVGGVTKGDHSVDYLKKMIKIKPANVTFVGEINENKLEEMYGTCKGFLTTSQKEDFGMTVLEAMSAGKSVIAVEDGGYKETVLDGKTGYFIEPQIDSLVNAIKKINKNPSKNKNNCIKQASKFTTKVFIKKMRNKINETIKNS